MEGGVCSNPGSLQRDFLNYEIYLIIIIKRQIIFSLRNFKTRNREMLKVRRLYLIRQLPAPIKPNYSYRQLVKSLRMNNPRAG